MNQNIPHPSYKSMFNLTKKIELAQKIINVTKSNKQKEIAQMTQLETIRCHAEDFIFREIKGNTFGEIATNAIKKGIENGELKIQRISDEKIKFHIGDFSVLITHIENSHFTQDEVIKRCEFAIKDQVFSFDQPTTTQLVLFFENQEYCYEFSDTCIEPLPKNMSEEQAEKILSDATLLAELNDSLQ